MTCNFEQGFCRDKSAKRLRGNFNERLTYSVSFHYLQYVMAKRSAAPGGKPVVINQTRAAHSAVAQSVHK
jgi:hypothetical protein